jgi:hypothetical protein
MLESLRVPWACALAACSVLAAVSGTAAQSPGASPGAPNDASPSAVVGASSQGAAAGAGAAVVKLGAREPRGRAAGPRFVAVVDLGPEARPAADVLELGPPAPQLEPVDPQLTALKEQRTAARGSARAHDHAFAPVVSANAQAGVQGQGGNVFPLYRVGLNVNVPLWDGGLMIANRAQANTQAAQLGAQATDYAAQREHQRRAPRPLGRKPSAASAYRRSSCSRAARASVSSKKAIRSERRAWPR